MNWVSKVEHLIRLKNKYSFWQKNIRMTPRQVIVKVMTVSKPADKVFNFFSDVKNMEIGGVIKSVTKGDGEWWDFDHTAAGKGRIRVLPVPELGILDHEFVAGGLEWKVYVRVIPNEEGSTTTWTFMRPDRLTDEQFQDQLKGFDIEVNNWKKYLDEH